MKYFHLVAALLFVGVSVNCQDATADDPAVYDTKADLANLANGIKEAVQKAQEEQNRLQQQANQLSARVLEESRKLADKIPAVFRGAFQNAVAGFQRAMTTFSGILQSLQTQGEDAAKQADDVLGDIQTMGTKQVDQVQQDLLQQQNDLSQRLTDATQFFQNQVQGFFNNAIKPLARFGVTV